MVAFHWQLQMAGERPDHLLENWSPEAPRDPRRTRSRVYNEQEYLRPEAFPKTERVKP